jgi:RNA polymerase sigma-70 factor (ECF subfamily)
LDRPAPEDAGADADVTTLHVRRAIDGDAASVAWVVERLSPLLLALARYKLSPSLRVLCEPEDLVNETWLITLPRLAEIEEREGRSTPVLLRFLTTTLLRRLAGIARKHARRAKHTAPQGGSSDRASDPDLDRLPRETRGVVTIALQRELQGQVLASLAELPEPDREVLLLRGVEQQSNQTVATLLGIEPGAASMRYQRALKRLRTALPGSVFDELPNE